ncbi:hypothetical protein MTO96_033595 [Rhipicephalus appendiculatus]
MTTGAGGTILSIADLKKPALRNRWRRRVCAILCRGDLTLAALFRRARRNSVIATVLCTPVSTGKLRHDSCNHGGNSDKFCNHEIHGYVYSNPDYGEHDCTNHDSAYQND